MSSRCELGVRIISATARVATRLQIVGFMGAIPSPTLIYLTSAFWCNIFHLVSLLPFIFSQLIFKWNLWGYVTIPSSTSIHLVLFFRVICQCFFFFDKTIQEEINHFVHWNFTWTFPIFGSKFGLKLSEGESPNCTWHPCHMQPQPSGFVTKAQLLYHLRGKTPQPRWNNVAPITLCGPDKKMWNIKRVPKYHDD